MELSELDKINVKLEEITYALTQLHNKTYELECAITKFKETFKQHPELCPHDYAWAGEDLIAKTKHYVCQLCGHEKNEPA